MQPTIENKRTRKFEKGDRVVVLKNAFDDHENQEVIGLVEGMWGVVTDPRTKYIGVQLQGRAHGKNVNDDYWIRPDKHSRRNNLTYTGQVDLIWHFKDSELEHAD